MLGNFNDDYYIAEWMSEYLTRYHLRELKKKGIDGPLFKSQEDNSYLPISKCAEPQVQTLEKDDLRFEAL